MRKSFFITLLILASCSEKPEAIPQGIISPDTMVRMLIDIHLAEGKISVRNLPPDSSLLYYQVLKDDIYNKFKVSSQKFEKSMDYYSRSNIKELDRIYEVVVDSLGLKESRGKID